MTKLSLNPNQLLSSLENELQLKFAQVEAVSLYNHRKVAKAFQDNAIGSEHFAPTSGYGHDDLGRDKFDKLFASVFAAEAAIARVNFVSGTHAIACAILGNLKAGENIVFPLGSPYDTLDYMLNHIKEDLKGKVKIAEPSDWNNVSEVAQKTIELIDDETKIIAIQRSRGYSAVRPSFTVSQIAQLISEIKAVRSDLIIFVDNCYGEFVEESEPLEVGADLIAGSLIKNPGGAIVLTGGYVAGKRELVWKASERLTAPGIGTEGGPNFNQGRLLFQGLYIAPRVVAEALKGMILSARVFEELGLTTSPSSLEQRTDIIQQIDFRNREKLIHFCKLLQLASPIDSHLTPFPSQTPGYQDELIMAAGTFIEGSTIELSADGPLREPYTAYLQGGQSYFYTRIFLEKFLEHFI